MKRIHIVGISPRTGTTLLSECMRISFKIDAVEAHEASIGKRKFGGPIYLTKNPFDIDRIGPRLRFDPRLSVICMVRDPRDVVVSYHGKDLTRYLTSLRDWKANLRYVNDLIGHPRFILLRYEDLVAAPDKCQDVIAERIPYLRKIAHFSQFNAAVSVSNGSSRALRGARPITADSVGNWLNRPERVAGQLIQYGPITQELIDLGYEKDDAWLDLLKSTTPDISQSVRDLKRLDKNHITRGISSYFYAAEHFLAHLFRLPYV